MKTSNQIPVSPEIWEFLATSDGPVVIHAGHFMLVSRGDSCEPTVVTGELGSQPAALEPNSITAALSHFTLETWRMGVGITACLRSRGQQADLVCLTNDWQHLRARSLPDAHSLRQIFYNAHANKLFPSFRAILDEHDLGEDAIMTLGRWKPFVSESWLRRRIERRLKHLANANNQLARRLAVEKRSDGTQYLVFDDFGRACRLLFCGQSDCAGEVMELVMQLHQKGYRRFLNIIPAECELPVNEGTRRAIALFGLADFSALNIAVPCFATRWHRGENPPKLRMSRVFAGQFDCGGDLDPVVESLSSGAG